MTRGERAADVVARMHPEHRALISTRAVAVLEALESTLADELHRANVLAYLDGLAPTFTRELRELLATVRKAT